MRRFLAFASMVLYAVFSSPVVLANSTLFVITSKDHALPDPEGVSGRLQVPVRMLEAGGVDAITASINDSLKWVSNYNEETIVPEMDRLRAEATAVSEARKNELHSAYVTELQIGEISSRYDVDKLPAVLELDSVGNYRKSIQPSSLLAAIGDIESQTWTAAPPKLEDKIASRNRVQGSSLRAAEGDSGVTVKPYGSGTQYSVINAVIDGMSPDSFDCLDARISGVCAYFVTRLFCSLTGCSITANPEASIHLTHSNPELLIGAYKRLGASSIKESQVLFGAIQNEASAVALEMLTGEPVPPDYHDTDKWAGTSSEGRVDGQRKTMKFHEVDVIGHPGTPLQFARANDTDPIPEFMRSLQNAPNNIVSFGEDIQGAITQSGASAQAVVANVPNGPPAGMESLVPSKSQLQMSAEQILPGGLAGVASSMYSFGGSVAPLLSQYMSGGVRDVVDGIVGEAGTTLSQSFGQIQGAIDAVKNIGGSLSVPGIGVSGTEMWSFCPGAGRFMKPYMLSGLNLLQWRFNLPEIVSPYTYAIPVPPLKHLVVGSPGSMSWSEASIDAPNNWGMIYPRLGFVQQPDEVKAAMVAAARAAHVVTRTGQKHVYSPLLPRSTRYLDIKRPPPFDPSDRTSGKWQMVAPEVDNQCYVFGEDDTVLKPWSADRMSDDQSYAMTLWREYSCCPEPRKNGAVTMVDINLGLIPLDIQLLK